MWNLMIAILLALPVSATLAQSSTPPNVKLESLTGECSLKIQWIGLVPARPEGVFLQCKGSTFLVLSPGNLFGHVSITSSSEALAFVRVFTAPTTCKYFDLDGMVEVVPGDVTETSDFNVVDRKMFEKVLTRASVTEVGGSPKRFTIKRTVVLLDQKVYEMTETIDERGLYQVISKQLLAPDAQKLGILHFGDLEYNMFRWC